MTMTVHPPRADDRPSAEIIALMNRLAAQGAQCYVKWTCPRCGDRVTANDANEFHIGGYRHETRHDGTECGAVYEGDQFGLQAIMGILPC